MTKVKQRRGITAVVTPPASEPTPAVASVRRKAVATAATHAKAPVGHMPSTRPTRGALPARRAAAARSATSVRRAADRLAATLTPLNAAQPTTRSGKPPAVAAVRGRTSGPVRGMKATAAPRAGKTPTALRSTTAPARKAVPTKAGRHGATARGKRPVPVKAPLPREIYIKALDPLRKCGPNTSVMHMFRVDESIGGAHAATHLVFYDRHGWYCVHGRTCQAVEDVRKHGGVKQVGLDYNGRMRA